MNITFQYGSGVLTLPKDTLRLLDSASAEDLRVLLLLAGGETDEETIARHAGCTVARVRRAVAFFADAGILSVSDPGREEEHPATRGTAANIETSAGSEAVPGENGATVTQNKPACSSPDKPSPAKTAARDVAADGQNSPTETVSAQKGNEKKAEKPSPADAGTGNPPLRRAEELPDYTTAELAALLEKRRDLAMLLEECQRAWGKVFNTHEANIVIGLIEYLGFDGEYILLLLSYCAKLNVRSLHSAERLAYRMHDEGTVTVDALREKLCRMEAAHGAEGMIRSMFGIGSRSLTEKEKAQIDLWINTYRFPEDIIRRAYEITVNVKSKPSVNYAGGILKRWYEAGLDTVEKIDRAETERQEKTAKNVMDAATLAEPGDSFWEAAVRASYGKDFARLGLGSAQPESTEEKSGAAQSEKGPSDR